MTEPLTQDAAPVDPARVGQRRSVLRGLVREPVGLICALYLLIVVIAAVAAPLIAPFDANLTRVELTNAPPFTTDFVLGGDSAGRDVLSRMIWATRGTLLACVVLLACSLAVGVTTGLVAGFYAGRTALVTNWLMDAIIALPGMVLLIALYTVIGTSIPVAMAVFGVMVSPSYYRLVRGVVASVRSELYVDAANVAGLSDVRIIFRHVLTAVRAPVIVHSAFVLAAGIGIQAGLAFLGLGDPQEPSWGGMLQLAFLDIYLNTSAVVWPSILISLTILAFVLLGNALRDAAQLGSRHATVSPRTRRRIENAARSTVAARPTSQRLPADDDGRTPLLSVAGLRVGYAESEDQVTEVVRGVDLRVSRGEIHGLVGESGSGKSQTIFAILDILPKEALILGGTVTFDGTEILDDRDALRRLRGRRIAYVPQEPMNNLDPTMTVGRQLMYGLRAARDIGRGEARRELLDLLGSVGIKEPRKVFDLYPHQISGGMAQRVLITGAVASNPDLILADEPTTALDVTVQADVLEILRTLRDERDLGMVLVTHNLGVVADICDTVSVMRGGVIVESADCETLFAAPEHPYTTELLAASAQGVRRGR